MKSAGVTAERDASVAEQQLCLFMEYAPASIAMFNRGMEYLAATRRWRETFRLGDANIFGRSHYEVVPWLPERWKAEYEHCLRGEALKWEEDYLERPDGSSDWLMREIHPWYDEHREVGGIIVFNEIVTDRKLAADEFERNQRFLNAVLESIQDGIVACDENHRLTVLNPAAERMLKSGLVHVPPERWPETYHIYEKDGKTLAKMERLPLIRAMRGEVVENEEFVLAPDLKAPRQIVCKAQAMHTKDGAKIGAVVSMQDVTEQREIEARYFQAQKLEAIGQLTGGLAHDFNNLLAVILGNLQLIQRAPDNREKLMRRLAASVAAAQRGAELTNRLLGFARRQTLTTRPVDASALIAGLEELLSRTLGEMIDVETSLDKDLWTIVVDDSQLEAAILNLAINARDAMESGGCLTISTENITFSEGTASQLPDLEPGDFVRISISDTGSGMPEEIRSRAFEPFFTTKEVGRGSGLGLSIVYGFMQQSGGQIELDSDAGRGTTVNMYFPRSFRSPETGIGDAGEAAEPQRAHEHILVVEDDAGVRDVAVALLREMGYEIAEASSGEAALEILRSSERRFDLLLTDVIMPGRLSGPALAKIAGEEFPHLRILFMSGYADAGVLRDGQVPNDIALVSKPLRREVLARKVRDALRQRHGKA